MKEVVVQYMQNKYGSRAVFDRRNVNYNLLNKKE